MHPTIATLSILAVASLAEAVAIEARSQNATPLTPSPSATTTGIDWFQTTPESYQGMQSLLFWTLYQADFRRHDCNRRCSLLSRDKPCSVWTKDPVSK